MKPSCVSLKHLSRTSCWKCLTGGCGESELWVEVFQTCTLNVSLFGGGALWGHFPGGVITGHADEITAATSALPSHATVSSQASSPPLSSLSSCSHTTAAAHTAYKIMYWSRLDYWRSLNTKALRLCCCFFTKQIKSSCRRTFPTAWPLACHWQI